MKSIIYVVIYLILSQFLLPLSQEVVEEITVEGSIQTEDMLSKKMIILDSEEIKKLGITEISDIFRIVPGVDVNRRGSGQTSFDLTMRGSNFEQILLMVNGIPVNNVQTGHFNTDLTFSVDDISKIEISQGANSVFYGPNGFAGIINIILKEGSGYSAGIMVGEKSLSKFSFSAGNRTKFFRYGFSAEDSSSSGYYEGMEFDNITLRGYVSLKNKRIFAKSNFGYLKKSFGAKNFYAPFPSFENTESGIFNFNLNIEGKIRHEISFSHSVHKDHFILDRYNRDLFNSKSSINHTYFKIHNAIQLGLIKLSVGGDVNFIGMNSFLMGDHNQRRNGLYLAGGLKKSGWGLDIGARISFINEHHGFFTYYIGFFHRFKNQGTVRFNFGKGVRSPSFTEMYYNSPVNKGDPKLKPEKSFNYEASFIKYFYNFNTSISVFYRKQDQMIDWVKSFGKSVWRVTNIERNDVAGFEFMAEYMADSAKLKAIFERIYVIGHAQSFVSKYGFRFPDLKLNFSYMQKISENFEFSSRYIYKRIYDSRKKASLLDIGLSWKCKRVKFSISVDNLLNSVIEEIPGIKISGRWVKMSITFRK